MEGEPQGGDRDIEEGNGEEDHPLAVQGAAGGTSFVEADDRGFSSQGSSDSDGDSSPNRKQAIVAVSRSRLVMYRETFQSGCLFVLAGIQARKAIN